MGLFHLPGELIDVDPLLAFPAGCQAYRGNILHFLNDPGNAPEPEPDSYEYYPDGLLVVHQGRVLATAPAPELISRLPGGTDIRHWPDRLIMPGFIDTHVHMPQLAVMASYGTQLLDWLETYTFPHEARFCQAGLGPGRSQPVSGFAVVPWHHLCPGILHLAPGLG